jgi:CRISPR/Cas system-associated endoribonuclease Cas2
MVAYREHIKLIQKEIDQQKEKSMDTKYMEEKKKKIEMLEKKLGQIRKQALFLGDMSEMHCKAIKQKKLDVDEEERDKVFLAEKVLKTRKETVKIKRKL